MSSLLQSLREQDLAVHDSYNANLTVNELAAFQESYEQVPGNIVFKAEMIPVQKFAHEGGYVYCVEMEDFVRLKKSQKIDNSTAINQIYESIKDEEDNDIESVEEITIVLEKEDPEKLEEKIKEDPKKIDAKCEAVESYMNMIKDIASTGVKIMYK